VLEKRDAEALALLRAGHERALALEVEQIRISQVSEATEQIEVLKRARDAAVNRYLHYQRLLGVTGATVPPVDQPIALASPSANADITVAEGVRMLGHDRAELDQLSQSHDWQEAASITQGIGSVLAVIPTIAFRATPWGIGVGSSWGGSNLASAASALAEVFRANSNAAAYEANRSARLAQHVVREHDWVLQSNQAALEIMHIDRQRLTAEIRKAIANAELAHHRTTMEQTIAVEDHLKEKYTNKELYDWMVGQISAVYFQAYQLAYDVAKRAERALRRELGITDSDYITFGYWDSLRKGLLSGERLHHAIARMEAAYFDQHRRAYEITKHVSLAALHPGALVELRETGQCYVQLPEALFDLDRPGDYQRMIKMVSVSIPCVTGPYASVNCRLTLLASQVRVQASTAGGYQPGPDDSRFRRSSGAITSIVTSSGREDAGLFAPDLDDERFLPFEGEGAISSWRLELPNEFRQFDYQSISDVVLHLRYTARDGGEPLRTAALNELTAALQSMEVEQGSHGLYRLFSARHDFPDAWQTMLHPAPTSTDPHRLVVTLGPDRFPFLYHDRALKIDKAAVFLRTADYDDSDTFSVVLQPPVGAPKTISIEQVETALGGLPGGATEFSPPGVTVTGSAPWQVELSTLPTALVEEVDVEGATVVRLKPEALADLGILVHYTF